MKLRDIKAQTAGVTKYHAKKLSASDKKLLRASVNENKANELVYDELIRLATSIDAQVHDDEDNKLRSPFPNMKMDEKTKFFPPKKPGERSKEEKQRIEENNRQNWPNAINKPKLPDATKPMPSMLQPGDVLIMSTSGKPTSGGGPRELFLKFYVEEIQESAEGGDKKIWKNEYEPTRKNLPPLGPSKDDGGPSLQLMAIPSSTGDFDQSKAQKMSTERADTLAGKMSVVKFKSGKPAGKPAGPIHNVEDRGSGKNPSELVFGESLIYKDDNKFYRFYVDRDGSGDTRLMASTGADPKNLRDGKPVEAEQADIMVQALDFVSAKGGFSIVDDLFRGKSKEEQEANLRKFLDKVDSVRKEYEAVAAEYRQAVGGGVSETYKYLDRDKGKEQTKVNRYQKSDIQNLQRKMGWMEEKISRLGNLYGKIVNKVGIGLDSDENIVWLKDSMTPEGRKKRETALPGLREEDFSKAFNTRTKYDDYEDQNGQAKSAPSAFNEPAGTARDQEISRLHGLGDKQTPSDKAQLKNLSRDKRIQELTTKARSTLALRDILVRKEQIEKVPEDSRSDKDREYLSQHAKVTRDYVKSKMMSPQEASELRSLKMLDPIGHSEPAKPRNPYSQSELPSKKSSFGNGDTGHFLVRVTHESGSPASPNELSGMLKSLGTSGIVQAQEEPGMFRIDLPEELEHMLIVDGKFNVQINQFVLESVGNVSGGSDVETEEASLSGDNLSTEEPEGTGKVGQAQPPPDPDAAPPAGGQGEQPIAQPPQNDAPPEDERSLEEVVETIKGDVDVLEEKIHGGEMMDGDMNLEPATSDTGAIPAPPGKIAVDQPAKDYWEGLLHEYGCKLTKDYVASISKAIDKCAASHGRQLSSSEKTALRTWMSSTDALVHGRKSLYREAAAAAALSPKMADVIHELLADQIMSSCGDIFALTASVKPHIFAMAVSRAGLHNRVSKTIEAARKTGQKMKSPSISKQLDDAVDVVKMEDLALDADPARGAHLDICIDRHWLEGAYIKMDLSWDADDKWSSGAVKNAIISFVKGLESKKEFEDLGVLGAINFDDLDVEGGVATVFFNASRPADAPTRVIHDIED